MSKISRREYLKQMGAAGLIVGAAELDHFALESTDATEHAANLCAATTDFRFRHATPDEPRETNLTVLFAGMMGFAQKRSGEVQVGFQKGNGKHRLEINLFLKIGNACSRFPSITTDDLDGAEDISLSLDHPSVTANFFHKAGFKRDDLDSPKDFGWMLDFESNLLYPAGITLIKRFNPVLTMQHGTFYTHQLSTSTFDIVEVPNSNPCKINHLPRLMGSAVEIPEKGRAILQVDGKVKAELPHIPNVRYEVQFLNECFESDEKWCEWKFPRDREEKKRNDFYMHHYMFKRNGSGTKKYGVIADDIYRIDGEIAVDPLNMCPELHMKGTDAAPCMGAGFGQTDGFL